MPLYLCVLRKAGTHLFKAVFEEMGFKCLSLQCPDAISRTVESIPPSDCRPSSRRRSFVLANTPPPRTFQGECEAGRARIIIGIRDPRAVFLSTLDFLDWRVPLPSPDWYPVAFLRSSLRHIYSSRLDLARGLLRGEALPDSPYDIEA